MKTKFQKELKSLIPYGNLPSVTAHHDDGSSNTQIFLPRDYKSFAGSDYYYGSKQSLVHFTTLEGAKAIMNSGMLWMTELAKLNDPREFTYGTTHHTVDSTIIEMAKRNAFSISFCEKDMVIRKSGFNREFMLWRLYGDDGNGCILEFEIDNERNDWVDFYLSEVKYGIRKKARFKTFERLNKSISNKGENVLADLSPLLFFHKSRLFQNEYEVKLIYDGRESGVTHRTTYYDANREVIFPKPFEGNEAMRLELPIRKYTNTGVGNERRPRLKLKRVILGYKKWDDFDKQKQEFNDMATKNLNYAVEVELSHLKKVFYGE